MTIRNNTQTFVTLPKLRPNDKVSVITPSAGLPGMFPWVYELGLERLQSVFQLMPVEYPATRQTNASLTERADDIMAAFRDPATSAVFSTIGGTDQIRLLRYLDGPALRAHPKPFFGFSDNTHLALYLWQLGIPSYYGGSIMNQFAMPGAMLPLTVESLRRALFEPGAYRYEPAGFFTEIDVDWADPASLHVERPFQVAEAPTWDAAHDAEGVLWGGCVESILTQLAAGRYVPGAAALSGCVLLLETSENMPPPWVLEHVITGMAERGWLARFQAVLVGRPKAWSLGLPLDKAARGQYRRDQRTAIVSTIRHYAPDMPVVQGLDIGHTDPQLVLPLGGRVELSARQERLTVHY